MAMNEARSHAVQSRCQFHQKSPVPFLSYLSRHLTKNTQYKQNMNNKGFNGMFMLRVD